MFTGIVAHVGQVRRVSPTPAGARMTIDLGPLVQGLALGDSVAVNGACLSACDISASEATFDVMGETLKRTTLGRLAPPDKVNLERALKASASLDGHIVQGHVDGMAKLSRIVRGHATHVLEFTCLDELTHLMVPKGSIAISGVSLTLVAVEKTAFSVALIPTTLDATTLGELRTGDEVNVETDIIGKYVLKFMNNMPRGEGITESRLRDLGFM